MFEDFFGLRGSPFDLSPDAGRVFWSKAHQEAGDFLRQFPGREGGLVAVTGEVGAGKTTVVGAWLAVLDRRRFIVAQIVSTQLDSIGLLQALSLALGLDGRPRDIDLLLAGIEDALASAGRRGLRVLLVVDEAQNLTPEAVERLLRLARSAPARAADFHGILIGQPELRQLLQTSLLLAHEQAMESFHLGPMEEFETRAYIEHRLAAVGWRHDPSFSAAAFERVYRAAEGIPRRVNALCNRLLLGAFLAQRHEISEADVEEAADELRMEIGADALPPPGMPGGALRGVPGTAGYAGVAPLVSGIAARIDRIERKVASLVRQARALADREAAAGARLHPPHG